MAALAAQVDGWAALYDASGAVVASAPEWAGRRAARLTADVQRLRERPAPASSVVGGAGNTGHSENADRVELHSLGTSRRPRAALAVGTAAALGTAERYAVHSAIALLTLTTERSRSLHEAGLRIDAAVLRMLLAGEPDHARTVAGDLYGGLLDAPFRVIVAESGRPGTGPHGRAHRGWDGRRPRRRPARHTRLARRGGGVRGGPRRRGGAGRPRRGTPGGAGHRRGRGRRRLRRARVRAGGRPPGRRALAGGDEESLVVGVSAPSGPIAASAAYKQAQQALSVARRRGRVCVEHEHVAAGSVLPLLADDAVRAFADGLLRALRDHDATGRGDLVASVRAWLSRHGQWDAAAADLGVHRHTLRYRMRRVEEILGRSLDDPDVRMELWLALKATAPE